MNRVALLGGSGFLGRAVSAELLRRGVDVRVVTRSASRVRMSAVSSDGSDGKLELHECNVVNESKDSVAKALDGCDGVVNFIGLLYESGVAGQKFAQAHTGLARTLKDVIEDRRCVQVSALGASKTSASAYARTKAESEDLLSGLAAILRPSIVYGPGDSFFNRFAMMAKFSPFLPAVGGGTTLYQPVHVDDLALAIVKSLDLPTTDTYELGGNDTHSFADLMRMVLRVKGMSKSRLVLPIPFPVANVQGAAFEALHSILPSVPPIITRDQVQLLKHDNVVNKDAKGFKHLGIEQRGCSDDDINYIKQV